MYNKLYIYFYDLYSPVAFFFLVSVCVCVCVHLWKEREQPWTNSMWRFRIQPGRERTRGGLFRSVTSFMPGKLNFISTY